MAKTIKEFGAKLGAAGTVAAMPGLVAGQALVNNAATIGGQLGQLAASHPYGTGFAGAALTGAVGVGAALAHQIGQAKGRRAHAALGIQEARK